MAKKQKDGYKIYCYYCGDTGICPHCGGSGKKECVVTKGKHQIFAYKMCWYCFGRGICRVCKGRK